MDGLRIPLLLFADDLSLVAHSHRRLMCLLRALREWCEAFGMSVNVRKCEVMHFHPNALVRAAARQALTVSWCTAGNNGMQQQDMPWVERARCLGIYFGRVRARIRIVH